HVASPETSLYARQGVERTREVGKAIVLANRIGVAFDTQRRRQRKIGRYLPCIGGINTHPPECNGHVGGQVVGFAVLKGESVGKILEPVGERGRTDVLEVHPWTVIEEVMVAHVVPAEIHAKLQVVVSPGPGKVIDELVLGNVAALREVERRVERCKVIVAGKIESVWEEAVHRCSVLCELRNVVAQCGCKFIRLIGTEDVSFLRLIVIGRLTGIRVKPRIHRIYIARLESVVELKSEKDIVFRGQLVIESGSQK